MRIFLGILIGSVLMISGCGTSTSSVASIDRLEGQVERKSGNAFVPAKVKDPLISGEAVKTAEKSSASLLFSTGSEVQVNAESYFEIGSDQKIGRQESGTAIYRIEKDKSGVQVETPHGNTTVLGTVFCLQVTGTATTILVEEGKVRFTSKSGTAQQDVGPGQKLVASDTTALGKPESVDLAEREALFNPNSKGPAINQR